MHHIYIMYVPGCRLIHKTCPVCERNRVCCIHLYVCIIVEQHRGPPSDLHGTLLMLRTYTTQHLQAIILSIPTQSYLPRILTPPCPSNEKAISSLFHQYVMSSVILSTWDPLFYILRCGKQHVPAPKLLEISSTPPTGMHILVQFILMIPSKCRL